MEKYVFRVYDEDFKILGTGIAGDQASANVMKDRMVEDYRAVGYKVRETDVVKIRILAAYAENMDMTFILRECCTDHERFSTEVIGAYDGRPNEEETRACMGQLTVEH